ncbi:MAG: PAS domain S-box protein [Myxococcales bacterium]|nr:PAS domain S-box protein [Myxococcales bacterium]
MRERQEELRDAVEAALAVREREISRLSRLYAALSRINQAIVATPRRDELFHEICRALCEHGGFRMSWIGWHLPDTNQIVPLASAGDDQGYLRSIVIYADEARPEGRGPTGVAFREGRPYISNHLLDDPASLPWRDEIVRRGFAASAVFPIREAGQVCGALSVYAEEVGYFQDREIGLLTSAANDLSFALDSLAREQARRHAEVVVRHERDFSAAVLDALPGILYLYDQRGRFLRWNRNFEQASGYTAAEIAAMHPLQFFAGDRELVATRIDEVFERGDSSVEAGFVSKDGRVTPYYFTGVKTVIGGQTCLVGVGIDVSERTRTEAARQASDARYRALFDYAPDGILVADARSYYLDANASMCRMLGYRREDLIGKHAADIVVQTEIPEISVALREIQSAADYHREWEFRRKDGSTFPADVIATPMPDGNILAMVRDISARKQAERALHELNGGGGGGGGRGRPARRARRVTGARPPARLQRA